MRGPLTVHLQRQMTRELAVGPELIRYCLPSFPRDPDDNRSGTNTAAYMWVCDSGDSSRLAATHVRMAWRFWMGAVGRVADHLHLLQPTCSRQDQIIARCIARGSRPRAW